MAKLRSSALLGVLVLLCITAKGSAAPNPSPPAAPPSAPNVSESDDANTDTPRRALERFLANARAGRLSEAADDLSQISQDVDEMAQLARKLQAVLDRRVPLDKEHLNKIPDVPSGSKDDGMLDQEEIGRIEMPMGSEPVRLTRQRRADGETHWVFSPRTVQRIGTWYERLEDHWLLDHLPEAMLVTGPGGLLYWQWLALPLLVGISAVFGVLFSFVVRLLLRLALFRRELFIAVLDRQTEALRLLGAALGLRALLLSLFITANAEAMVRGLCNVLLIIGLSFSLWRIMDVLAERARESAWLKTRPALVGVMPLLRRLAEVALWSVGVLWSLGELGYSVTAVLASLGLGGLAVALAAKNSLEHLIGGVTLSLDQPMRVGDQVKIGDVQGHVEEIGIRSTRIRTLDRSLVTIPNGKLADLNIETLAARDRLRLTMALNINAALKAPGLRELRTALLARISEQPLVIKDKVRVHFSALNEFAIPLDITCWFETGDQDQFHAAREGLLLAILEVVDAHGALAPGKPKDK